MLYSADEGGQRVEAFRFGPWVERLRKTAESIKMEKAAAIEAEEKARQEKAVEPFSRIDF